MQTSDAAKSNDKARANENANAVGGAGTRDESKVKDENSEVGTAANSRRAEAARDPDPTAVYRVGVGDVLDIRLLNAPRTRRSTLFTVLEGGLLDYPLAGKPRVVEGLTTDEIAARLASSFRLRSLFTTPPRLLVSVREYASHLVTVEGLVREPGTKIIRREAVPLYVVVADAQPRREAGAAVVRCRLDGRETHVDLSDLALMKTPVHAGDAVTVRESGRRFFVIEGLVAQPGKKEMHAGMTLTQAIMQAGGLLPPKSLGAKERERLLATYGLPKSSRSAYLVVIVAREEGGGAAPHTAYNLKEIEEGRAPDPALRPGDLVLVIH
ncbi:MAG TPA: polysaccharide biosynthesis/export family protein [Pyrinomonadaceae bacterium]|nr:polysaccharide biosynthesis/export family protein [Pyrinomonadaceae bacterium]